MSLAHVGQVGSRALAAVVQTGWLYPLCALLVLLSVWLAWLLRFLVRRRQLDLVLSERTRMAREIHDTLLQSLVGITLKLDTIQERHGQSADTIREQLVNLRMQVQGSVREARQSIWNLRSRALALHDLPAALLEAGDSITFGSDVKFELAVSGARSRVAPQVQEQLLRIAQEAVGNAVRHSNATVVRVSLFYSDDSVRLRVSDDGCGFDSVSELQSTGTHWGLRGMQERALQIGSRLVLVSKPGEGTVLETTAPFSTAA